MARSYERLSPEAMDEIWVRLRAGHAAKPTARQLGISASTVRARICCGAAGSGRTHDAGGRVV